MKKVVITGSAGGMGRAVALKLAENGYYVYSCDIKTNSEEIENIRQIEMDVCSQQSIDEAFAIVSSETDQLDAIINFAGIIMMNSLVEISEQNFFATCFAKQGQDYHHHKRIGAKQNHSVQLYLFNF